MGRFTSDHNVTVRNNSGQITNQYTAKGQIDPAKVAGGAMGPLIVVVLVAVILMAVFPVAAYLFLLWRMFQVRKTVKQFRDLHAEDNNFTALENSVLNKTGFKSIAGLQASTTTKLFFWLLGGGLLTAVTEYIILTGELELFADALGFYFINNIHDDNFINRIFEVYEVLWPVIIGYPLVFGAFFCANELATEKLINAVSNKWVLAASMPYRFVYFICIAPFRRVISWAFSSVKLAILSLVCIIALAGGHLAFQTYSNERLEKFRFFADDFYLYENKQAIVQSVQESFELHDFNINANYGGLSYIFVPGYAANYLLDLIDGGTMHRRDWLQSGYVSRNTLSKLVIDLNQSKGSLKQFRVIMEAYKTMGGDFQQTDLLGNRAWIYTKTIKGYKALKMLNIELSTLEKAFIYDNLVEYENSSVRVKNQALMDELSQ
ncbi:MAG: hypothetical protein ACPGF7_03500 [Pontibacterium sp.]